MSTASRIIQTVRPHIPMIKFRKGQMPAAVSTDKTMDMTKTLFPAQQPSSTSSAQSTISSLPKVGNTPRGSAVIDDLDLPTKYQRKLLTEEEIAFIERGGPE